MHKYIYNYINSRWVMGIRLLFRSIAPHGLFTLRSNGYQSLENGFNLHSERNFNLVTMLTKCNF